MFVDEDHTEPFALAQVVRCSSAKAAGTNDDSIRLADHDAHALGKPPRIWRQSQKDYSLALKSNSQTPLQFATNPKASLSTIQHLTLGMDTTSQRILR
jgi:hypothetical protein